MSSSLLALATCSQPVPQAQSPPPQPPEIVRLTDTGARNGQATYSPEGGRILFISNREGNWDVYSMASDGTDTVRLTDGPGAAGWPTFSADGTRFYWYSAVESTFRAYSAAAADGSDVRSVLEGPGDFRPSPSPDGSELLFDRFGHTEPPNHDLMILHLESGAVRQLTTDPGYDSDARWSPDGSWIVFHSDRLSRPGEPYSRMEIYRIRPDGSGLEQLTDGGGRNQYPTWSPDGSRIAYVSDRTGNRDIWIMAADGSGTRQVTFHPGDDSTPAWSLDGAAILFSTDRFGGEELCLVQLE